MQKYSLLFVSLLGTYPLCAAEQARPSAWTYLLAICTEARKLIHERNPHIAENTQKVDEQLQKLESLWQQEKIEDANIFACQISRHRDVENIDKPLVNNQFSGLTVLMKLALLVACEKRLAAQGLAHPHVLEKICQISLPRIFQLHPNWHARGENIFSAISRIRSCLQVRSL